MDPKRVGRRIKAFRKLKGYTQVGFAKKINVNLTMLGSVERGAMEASEELIDQITDTLAISKEELILTKEPEEKE